MHTSLFIAKSFRKLKIVQRGWLWSFNFHLKSSHAGTAAKIPILKNVGWNNIFEKEPWMSEILTVILPVYKGNFIDVGVNIGQTLLKVKSIDPGRAYYGFEVNPSCIAYLKELVKVNRFRDITLFPFGLSDTTGISKLHFYYENEEDVTASVIGNYRPDNKVVRTDYVILSRLDEIETVTQPAIGIIKIDVEGAELEVLRGALDTLIKYRPVIIIEILPAYSNANRDRVDRQNNIELLIKGLNYRIFRIEKDPDGHFDILTQIHSFPLNGNLASSDYLFIPEEKTTGLSITNQ